MHVGTRTLVAVTALISICAGHAFAQAPTISSISPSSGAVSTSVMITGTNFGSSQGSSTVSLNGTSAAVASWSNTNIVAVVPTGATSGLFAVTVNSQTANSSTFTVTTLPSGWTDSDIGSVGIAGSASYSNGTFTVKGAGQYIWSTADSFNFAYQSWTGNGAIVARVVSVSGSEYAQAGVMIRETLNTGSTNGYMAFQNNQSPSSMKFFNRTSTGGSTSAPTSSGSLPYWVEVVRSGSTFSGYISPDGVNWTQVGSNVTINMAQSVYVGLGVSSDTTSSLATATFDSVYVSSSSGGEPSIANVTATSGSVGTQIGISGSNFGASEASSVVMLNGVPMTTASWSSSAIIFTIPAGATSGLLRVFVGPSMNASNSVSFTVTAQPLPPQWLDQDIGSVPTAGSATYSNGVFTVNGSGMLESGSFDGFHFAYQSLSGDGSIVARITSLANPDGSTVAGIMIRETLSGPSTFASTVVNRTPSLFMLYRTTTGGSNNYLNNSWVTVSFPYWLKLVRSGNTFSAYMSPDGVNWIQNGSNQTISMAQNVNVGLAVSSGQSAGPVTATFDNVSINMNSDPNPAISSVSTTTGSVGSQITISGSNFGATQGSSVVTINGTPLTINYWTATSIVATIPTGTTSGLLIVSVAPDMDDSNDVYFTVESHPLPVGWLDIDIGVDTGEGSASYSNGTFTVNGLGVDAGVYSDVFHFAYQPMQGDGSIVARVVNVQGASGNTGIAGVMIRETLNPGSTYLDTNMNASPDGILYYRTSTSGDTNEAGFVSASLPYWVKAVRSNGVFSGYISPDGLNWTQVGSSQTISMAQNVYVGLAVSSGSWSTSTTGTFDNVSITVGTTPYLSGISPTIGGVGTSVTIAGSNFGATQGNSTVTFNGATATATSWSNSQIVATVPSAVPADAGPVVVTVNAVASVPTISFTAVKPVISSLSPPQAPIGGAVTLNGSGFGPSASGSTVQFNSVAATVTSWSDTSITVTVPSNATSGTVSVIEDGFASNTASFTVIEALSVTGVSPATGPIGTTVTISGTGFGATQSNSVASFYGAAGTIVGWSDTSIVATVPVGSSSGDVSVTVAATTVQGPPFTLTSGLTVTDSLSNTTTYNSEIAGGTWVVTNSTGSGCSTCTQRGNITKTYDSYGNVLTDTNENNHTRTYTYDSNGNVLTLSEPDGNGNTLTTTYTYNSFNEVLTVTDPMGFVITNTYDANGNLLTVTTPKPNSSTNASVTQFAYNSLGQMTQITDPLNNVTKLAYTSAGLIYTITDAQNNATTYGYDNFGNRTSVTDALNHHTTFTYDSMNRLTKITYPDSTTTQFAYDYRGRRTSVTDQNGKVTQYAYDDADRLITVTDAASNVTTYGYDTEDNLTSIKDANSNTTSFSYDGFGRVNKTTFPSGYVETYNYDAVGNLTGKTDRKNQSITYTYDQLNRLTQKSYPDTSTVNYTYDLDSRLTQVTDPTGTYQFTFDNMGRLTSASTSYTFLTARNFTTSYSYDAASNRTGFTDPENGSTTYAYDTLNRLQTLTPPTAISGGSFGFSYDVLSRRTQMTRPNNITTNYTYDNLSRLLSILHQSGSTVLDGASYTLDNVGNPTAKTNQQSGVTSNYTYDPIYELTQVAQAANTTESYSYDPVGNRLSSLSGSYSYNSSNELTSAPSTSYTYDYDGNMLTSTTSSNTTSYTWDFENRLTSVTLPNNGGTISFKYDPFGRRIYKSSSNGTFIYAYDGDNVMEETNSSGAAVARYAQELNIDEPLAMLRSSATSFYHADGLGSVTSLSNTAGALAQTYTFDSFGKQTASSGSLTNHFQYTAREWDSETSLYYYRARYDDPSLGRFTSEDPLGAGGGISAYAYTDNDPLRWADPFGLIPRVPRCPENRLDIPRSGLDGLIGPVSPTDSANLDRGCIGMASAYQGMNAIYPEQASGTQCFTTEAQAQARPCKPSEKKFIFAKQGQYQNGPPTPGSDGTVPNNTISSLGGYYNYVTKFPGGCYGWMNHKKIPGGDPQMASISPNYPRDPHYPHTIWCSTCCPNCMNSH